MQGAKENLAEGFKPPRRAAWWSWEGPVPEGIWESPLVQRRLKQEHLRLWSSRGRELLIGFVWPVLVYCCMWALHVRMPLWPWAGFGTLGFPVPLLLPPVAIGFVRFLWTRPLLELRKDVDSGVQDILLTTPLTSQEIVGAEYFALLGRCTGTMRAFYALVLGLCAGNLVILTIDLGPSRLLPVLIWLGFSGLIVPYAIGRLLTWASYHLLVYAMLRREPGAPGLSALAAVLLFPVAAIVLLDVLSVIAYVPFSFMSLFVLLISFVFVATSEPSFGNFDAFRLELARRGMRCGEKIPDSSSFAPIDEV